MFIKKVIPAVFVLLFALQVNGSAVKLIPAGKWSIATGGNNSRQFSFCAKELQELLACRIGKKIPILKNGKLPAAPVILLDKNDPALESEEFRIVREKNVIRITGGSPIGTLYGVYEFLQQYCDVWNVAPGVIYTPKNKPLSFGTVKKQLKPAIAKREIYHVGGDYTKRDVKNNWRLFDLRNRISISNYMQRDFFPYTDSRYRFSRTAGNSCHSFYHYVSPEKYGKTHPEYFSMNRDGIRVMKRNAGGQLCLTNPDVKKIVYEHLLSSIRKDRKKFGDQAPKLYDFSQMDNTPYLCYCPECKKIIARYGNADSGLLLWFVNQVAREIRKHYPDVTIRTFAYVNTEKIPAGIRAEDNVLIQLCDLYSKSNHTLPLTHTINKKRSEIVKDWKKTASKLMIWDYILQDGNEPIVPVDAVASDVKFFRSCGVKWIFMESEVRVGNPSAFECLKNFVLAQLYFDPEQDLEKLLDVYCRGYFGAAHKEMRAYLEHLRQGQKRNPTSSMNAWHLRELPHLTIDFLRKGKDMVKKAMDKNKDPQIALRILCEMNVLDNALTRIFSAYPKFAKERQMLLKNLLPNRLKVLRSYGLIDSRRKKVEEAVRLPIEDSLVVFTDIPEELKKFPAGAIRFLGISRQFRGGVCTRYVKDPDSKLPRVLGWFHSDPRKFTEMLGCGVYDNQRKKAFGTRIKATTDEKYHWRKIVRFKMGPSSYFYALNWHAQFNLKGLYILADGVDKDNDPNLYDIWVSIKFQGPAYKKGSKKENAVLFERALLVPVAKKYGNL